MVDYHVIIPTERYRVVTFKQEHLPGVAVINQSLRGV